MFENFSNFFRNEVNYLVGVNQEFDQLLEAGDISRVLSKMECRYTEAMANRNEYEAETHEVMNRQGRAIVNKMGVRTGYEKVAKLPIPYQKYINEMALTFLLGKPVSWANKGEGSDNAFEAFKKIVKRVHLNSRLREAKRLAGAEGESALLFHVYQEDGKADVLCRVLSAGRGDKVYSKWDIYGNLQAVAWGYFAKVDDKNVQEFVNVYTSDYIYNCRRDSMGWHIEKDANLIGKIPVIIFRQETEWHDVQKLIERTEDKHSRTADTNDYFEDPMLLLKADVIKNMPEKKENHKTIAVHGDTDLDKAGKFLTYDQASESKNEEFKWLDQTILKMSFTPDITIDVMRQVAQLSAKALRTVLLLGYVKADRRKDTWDEMLDRTASLLTAIVANVIDVSLDGECKNMSIEHIWNEPFGDDITDTLKNLAEAFGAGLMSEETAIEQNPLVQDKELEKERMLNEGEEKRKRQEDIFNVDEDGGAGSGE